MDHGLGQSLGVRWFGLGKELGLAKLCSVIGCNWGRVGAAVNGQEQITLLIAGQP